MKKKINLFNTIAPIYGLFYQKQKRYYEKIINDIPLQMDTFHTLLDVGCGTGAFTSVCSKLGLQVTGIDRAQKMIDIAQKKPDNQANQFICTNILKGLPFEDKAFDVSVASFVCHGLKESDRKFLYQEMSRVTKHWVILHDYNEKRSVISDLLEYLEGGDYFHFIKKVKIEMHTYFKDVSITNLSRQAAWYQGRPVS